MVWILFLFLLDGVNCQNFHNYFKFSTHDIRTRNQGKLLILPDVRLGTSQSVFLSWGREFSTLCQWREGCMRSLLFRRGLTVFLVVSDFIATQASCLYSVFDLIRVSRYIGFWFYNHVLPMTLTVIGSFNLTYDLPSFQIEIVLHTLILTLTFVHFCVFHT